MLQSEYALRHQLRHAPYSAMEAASDAGFYSALLPPYEQPYPSAAAGHATGSSPPRAEPPQPPGDLTDLTEYGEAVGSSGGRKGAPPSQPHFVFRPTGSGGLQLVS